MDLSESDKANLDALNNYENVNWFIEAKKLTPGCTFGEIALTKEVTRSATIKCVCNCYFATLNKKDF